MKKMIIDLLRIIGKQKRKKKKAEVGYNVKEYEKQKYYSILLYSIFRDHPAEMK